MSKQSTSKFSETYIKKFNLQNNNEIVEKKDPVIIQTKDPVIIQTKDFTIIQTEIVDLIVDKLTKIESFLEELKLNLQKKPSNKKVVRKKVV